jgi:hypothetical protein
MVGLPGDTFDDVEGASLGLFVEAAEVFAHDAEDKKLDAGKEGDGGHETGPPGLDVSGEPPDEGVKEEGDGESAGAEADPTGDLEGFDGKGGDAVEGEAKHFGEGVVSFAGEAWGAVVDEGDLGEADPGNHAADEAVAFGHGVEDVEGAAGDEAKVAGVEGDGAVGEAVDEAVEEGGGAALEEVFAGAFAALTVDDIGALVHEVEHIGEQFGRVLEVGVEDENALAAADAEAGGEGELMAVVS